MWRTKTGRRRFKGWGVLQLKMKASLVSILYSREASTVGR